MAALQIGVVPTCVARAQQAMPSVDGRVQRVTVRSGDPSERPLQPGDKVKLTIWREPDMTGEFVVQPNGAVDFPKIGRVQVDRLSTDSLKKVILAGYSVSLRDAAIEVTPLRRIVVEGSVRNAGFQYADPTVTVRGALALAGGVTTVGNQKRIELLRDGKETSINLASVPSLADSPAQSGDQIRVPERSWVARNAAVLGSGLTAVAILVAARMRP
jgi:protein involved in polysaccharide export with SLBB domain